MKKGASLAVPEGFGLALDADGVVAVDVDVDGFGEAGDFGLNLGAHERASSIIGLYFCFLEDVIGLSLGDEGGLRAES